MATATTDTDVRTRLQRAVVRPLHDEPPVTPAGLLLRAPATVPIILGAFLLLALLAAIAHGAILLTWDEPIQRWIEAHRTDALDTFFLYMSRFGGTQVVVAGLAILLVLVWRTCRPLLLLLLVATLARPLIEWSLKALVDRDRPDMDRLVDGTGPSFPSGHPMAAMALWGLVPPVVALLTDRRVWWWIATVISGTLIIIIAASRVYLGVHWFTDVVAALLFGSLFLLVVEWLFHIGHRRYPCAHYGEGCEGHPTDVEQVPAKR
jgi:undecaprenyl-diphosphatase